MASIARVSRALAASLRRLTRASSIGVGALIALVLGGCERQLPPPATPDRVLPHAPAPLGPPAQGMGQVTIDTVFEPAHVEEITGRTEIALTHGEIEGVTLRDVCLTTPCSANLLFGPRQLRFTSLQDPQRSGIGTLVVGAQPSAYRFALGHRTESAGPRLAGVLTLVGGLVLPLTGVPLYAIGSATDAHTHMATSPAIADTGIGLIATGGALLVTSIVLLTISRPEVQQGTGIQWIPAP
jgi:hypothetical protein